MDFVSERAFCCVVVPVRKPWPPPLLTYPNLQLLCCYHDLLDMQLWPCAPGLTKHESK